MGVNMKLFILSDTHDRLSKIPFIQKAIKDFKPEIVLHLGDFVSPFFIRQLFADIRNEKYIEEIILIKGNNDGDCELINSVCKSLNLKFYTEFFSANYDGKRIFAIHKPELVESIAKSDDYDFIFYGHTHKKEIKNIGKTIIANPGTASGYLAEDSTYMILDTSSNNLDIHIF